MRVLVAMHMAVELAAQDVFERFDGNLRFLSLIAFAVARPFMTVVLFGKLCACAQGRSKRIEVQPLSW
jgi:hypothetical protein